MTAPRKFDAIILAGVLLLILAIPPWRHRTQIGARGPVESVPAGWSVITSPPVPSEALKQDYYVLGTSIDLLRLLMEFAAVGVIVWLRRVVSGRCGYQQQEGPTISHARSDFGNQVRERWGLPPKRNRTMPTLLICCLVSSGVALLLFYMWLLRDAPVGERVEGTYGMAISTVAAASVVLFLSVLPILIFQSIRRRNH